MNRDARRYGRVEVAFTRSLTAGHGILRVGRRSSAPAGVGKRRPYNTVNRKAGKDGKNSSSLSALPALPVQMIGPV
jgi:hypothetical protein